MIFQPTRRFPHRHNKDGSYDSICISCYATIASVRNEAELAKLEQDHVCEMVFLNPISQPSGVPGKHYSEEPTEQP